MKKVIVAMSLGLCAVTSQAANWVHLGEGIDKSTIAVDTESISRDSNNRNLVNSWYRMVYANGSYSLVMTKIDCKQKMVIHLGFYGYSPDHYQTSSFGATSWSYIIPETMGEAHMKFVCKK